MTAPITKIGPRPPVVAERFTKEELRMIWCALAKEAKLWPEPEKTGEHRLAILIQAGRKA